MARLFAASILIVAVLPALASEPGQPLDCSDLAVFEPGYACQQISPRPCTSEACRNGNAERVIDNQGRIIYVKAVATGAQCNIRALLATEIRIVDGLEDRLLARIEDRCVVEHDSFTDVLTPAAMSNGYGRLSFDEERGRLLIPMASDVYRQGGNPPNYGGGAWLMAIDGFAREFDILNSYIPDLSAIAFRAPSMAFGFPAVDQFDTFYGDISALGDFTQAHPLQCDYPSSPPQVGDYLTVADTLPDPPAGHGRYYITAATYQGQTRYGRQGHQGHLSGRDPALLPVCTQLDTAVGGRR